MKKITVFFFLLLSVMLQAQVGVNTTTPDPSSMLDIASTNKGVLVPRVSLANVTTTMLDGTNTAAIGLLIWNTNAATVGGNGVGFYFFNGTQWIPITQTITGNTLDQSYDQGGAGVGKNINATDGAVRINGDDGFLVTGIFGTGNIIDTEVVGNGARMFFNPRKAAFRAGFAEDTRWNDASIGDYSFAVNRRSLASGFASVSLGYDSEAVGNCSFVAGYNSAVSSDYGVVFGRDSYVNSGSNSGVVFGYSSNVYNNYGWAVGEQADTYGEYGFAKGLSVTSRSFGETVFGFFNTDYTPNSLTGYNAADRLFVLGNGTNASNLSNALTIFKDGRMNINDAYTMPTSDGTNGQVMQTNGAGNVSWATPAIATDDQNLITPTLVGTTLNLNIENGTGTSIDLAPLQDGTGTDNQTLALAGNNLSISGGNTVNLSALNTDDQNLVTPTLVGTTLNLNIENGLGTSIDLAPLQDGTGTDDQTIDNFSLSGTTLRLSLENDGQPLQTVNLASLAGTDDQNLVTPTLVGTTLNLNIENGLGTSIDLAPLQDGTGTDDQTIDNFSLSGTTLRLSLENDGQPLQTVNLASINTDDQNLVTPTLVGTTLNLNIENGLGTSIDLAPLQDGTGTDDQTIDNFSLSGTTLRLSLENDGQPLQTVNLASLAGTDDQNLVAPTLVGTTLNLNIENGLGTSIDLAPLQDGTGTDDQTIDNFSLSGTTLRLSLENDGQPLQTVNLASINTDDQNLVTPTLVGTTLNLNIENGTGTSIDLAPLQDGTGTDDQTIDNFSLSGSILRLSLENDGQPLQTVNLATINTDDQNLVTPTLVGTTLNLNIENGTSTSIDLAPLQDGIGTDDQNIQNLAFNAVTNVLTVGIENGTSQTVSLAALATGGDIQGVTAGAGLTGGGTTGTVTVTAAANNGLNVDTLADNIQLGGPLVENTSISQGIYSLDINLDNTGDFSIQDNGTDVFFVEDTGDIGIGTSNPVYPLHIVENVAATTQGVYIDKTDNTTAETSGLYIQKTGTGTGRSHAIYTNIDGTGTGQKYGIFNNITSNAIGNQYGTRNYINSATSSFIFGTFNNLDNAGTGNQYGVYNGMRGTSAANLYGTYNEFNSPSIAIETAGVYNSFSDGTPGTSGIMGVYSEFSNPSNGTYYGVRNAYTAAATGTGIKYGTYNLIPAAAGGTHYGTFNSVDVSNGWAGYFVGRSYFSDRLSVGETNNVNAAISINKNSTGTYSHLELKESVADDGARIRFTNAAELTNEWVLFGRADNTNSDSSFNIFNNVSGNVVVVNGDGRVGIMRAPATNALEVNGNASKTVAGAFIANSDSRLKKDIATISANEALDKILKLRGVTYYWNDDKTGTTRPENLQMGFIAQEIAEVFPEKVTEDNLGYLQTAYGDYDPIVFQAIKALNDKIEKLEKENATLKSIVEKVNALEAKLDQMNLK